MPWSSIVSIERSQRRIVKAYNLSAIHGGFFAASFDAAGVLKAERLFCIASSKNEALAIIPTEIPQRIKTLIDIVKKDKTLVEVLEKWAKRTILTGIPPIRIRNTNKILKEQLSKIFFQDEAEWEDYWRKRGFTDFEELAKTNFSYFLGSEHGVFLKPVGYE